MIRAMNYSKCLSSLKLVMRPIAGVYANWVLNAVTFTGTAGTANFRLANVSL